MKKVNKKTQPLKAVAAAPAPAQVSPLSKVLKWKLNLLAIGNSLMYVVTADGIFAFSGVLLAQPMDVSNWYRYVTQLATAAGRIAQTLGQQGSFRSSVRVKLALQEESSIDYMLAGAVGMACACQRLESFDTYTAEVDAVPASMVAKQTATLSKGKAEAVEQMKQAEAAMPEELQQAYHWLLEEATL